jgi:hypothetical protein
MSHAAKAHAAMENLANGLDPEGKPLDWVGAAMRARTEAQKYARQIRLGEERTRLKTHAMRFKG